MVDNYLKLSELRNHILAEAAQVSAVSGREDRVEALLNIHSLVTDALAGEGVVLPCHDDTTKETT